MKQQKAEVLRYLGHRGQDVPTPLSAMVEECMKELREKATPRHVERTFSIIHSPEGILLEHTVLTLVGKDILRHLAGCSQVVLMGATLGIAVDNLIRQWETRDITRSLVLDACATQFIEECCDNIENLVCQNANENGLNITSRFSPGYGDLPLEIQPKLLAVLDAPRKIGLTCTENLIMLPRKSVTALIGVGEKAGASSFGCQSCSTKKTCTYRKRESK